MLRICSLFGAVPFLLLNYYDNLCKLLLLLYYYYYSGSMFRVYKKIISGIMGFVFLYIFYFVSYIFISSNFNNVYGSFIWKKQRTMSANFLRVFESIHSGIKNKKKWQKQMDCEMKNILLLFYYILLFLLLFYMSAFCMK